jgi:hypothetical protein
MKENSFWVKYFFNTSNDIKFKRMINELGHEAFAIYIYLVELLGKQENCEYYFKDLEIFCKEKSIKLQKVLKIIKNFEIFFYNDEIFYLNFLKKEMENLKKKIEKQTIGGRKGGLKRQANLEANLEANLKVNLKPILRQPKADIDIDKELDLDKEKEFKVVSSNVNTIVKNLNFTKKYNNNELRNDFNNLSLTEEEKEILRQIHNLGDIHSDVNYIKQIRKLGKDRVIGLLKEFLSSDISKIKNKSAYFTQILKEAVNE